MADSLDDEAKDLATSLGWNDGLNQAVAGLLEIAAVQLAADTFMN